MKKKLLASLLLASVVLPAAAVFADDVRTDNSKVGVTTITKADGSVVTVHIDPVTGNKITTDHSTGRQTVVTPSGEVTVRENASGTGFVVPELKAESKLQDEINALQAKLDGKAAPKVDAETPKAENNSPLGVTEITKADGSVVKVQVDAYGNKITTESNGTQTVVTPSGEVTVRENGSNTGFVVPELEKEAKLQDEEDALKAKLEGKEAPKTDVEAPKAEDKKAVVSADDTRTDNSSVGVTEITKADGSVVKVQVDSKGNKITTESNGTQTVVTPDGDVIVRENGSGTGFVVPEIKEEAEMQAEEDALRAKLEGKAAPKADAEAPKADVEAPKTDDKKADTEAPKTEDKKADSKAGAKADVKKADAKKADAKPAAKTLPKTSAVK